MGPGTGCGLQMLAGRGTQVEKGDGWWMMTMSQV
jgi:hypothetical protein